MSPDETTFKWKGDVDKASERLIKANVVSWETVSCRKRCDVDGVRQGVARDVQVVVVKRICSGGGVQIK